jgi:hypothetical protein
LSEEDAIFDVIKSNIHRLSLSESDKTVLLTSMWTFDQVAKITDEHQYKLYAERQAEIRKKAMLPSRDSPDYNDAFAAFIRSPEGMFANVLGARMSVWRTYNPDKASEVTWRKGGLWFWPSSSAPRHAQGQERSGGGNGFAAVS